MSSKVHRQGFLTFSEWVFIHNMLASTHLLSPPPISSAAPGAAKAPEPEATPPPPAPAATNMFIIFLLLAASVARAFFCLFPQFFCTAFSFFSPFLLSLLSHRLLMMCLSSSLKVIGRGGIWKMRGRDYWAYHRATGPLMRLYIQKKIGQPLPALYWPAHRENSRYSLWPFHPCIIF